MSFSGLRSWRGGGSAGAVAAAALSFAPCPFHLAYCESASAADHRGLRDRERRREEMRRMKRGEERRGGEEGKCGCCGGGLQSCGWLMDASDVTRVSRWSGSWECAAGRLLSSASARSHTRRPSRLVPPSGLSPRGVSRASHDIPLPLGTSPD